MNETKISSLAKNPHYYVINFLSLITLGFGAAYIYGKFVQKLNIMSRFAFGSDDEWVNFSARFMYCALILFWGPIALALVALGVIE